MNVKVSIIIPVYNVEKFIEKSVRSLFAQSLDKIEYIFINDNTSDSSIDIINTVLQDFPKRKNQIKIINHTINQGTGKSRQEGINEARGEYIIHCDPDDWVDPEMYEKMYLTAKHEKSDLVICNIIEEPSKNIIQTKIENGENKNTLLDKIFKGEIHCSLTNKLIKKEIYKQIDPLFESGLNYWEDVSVLPRLIYLSNNISFMNQPFYHYFRCNEYSYTHLWKSEYTNNVIRALEINNQFFKTRNSNISLLLIRGIALILEKENYKLGNNLQRIYQLIPKHLNYKVIRSRYRQLLTFFFINHLDHLALVLTSIKKIKTKGK